MIIFINFSFCSSILFLFNILDIKLIEGERGVFEVSVNRGLKVFSKKKTGRFPISSVEVSQAIRDVITEGRLR